MQAQPQPQAQAQAQTQGRSTLVLRDYLNLAPFLGLGFYHAWLSLSFYTTSLFVGTEHTTNMVNSIWVFGALGFAMCMTLFIAPMRKILEARIKQYIRATIILAAGFTAAGTAAPAIANLLVGHQASVVVLGCAIAGTGIAGCFSGLLVLLWGITYAKLHLGEIICFTFCSRMVGSLVFVCTKLLPDPIRVLVIIFLPLLSGVLLALCARNYNPQSSAINLQETLQDGKQLFPRFSKRLAIPLAALFLYALGGELLRELCLIHDNFTIDVMGTGYAISIGATAAVALIVAAGYLRNNTSLYTSLHPIRYATLFMAASFIIFAWLQAPTWFAYAVFGVGFFCMNAFAWIVGIAIARRFETPSLFVVALSQIPTSFAPCLLPILQPVMAVLSGTSSETIDMAAMLFSCLIFAIATFLLREKDIRTVWGVLPPSSNQISTVPAAASNAPDSLSYSDRFARLAASYGLTQRETEVAELLARGRNLPFIEENLVISHGTAQTHQRHIYQKMAVHSRQEFINLVEHLIDQGKH